VSFDPRIAADTSTDPVVGAALRRTDDPEGQRTA
jgi:hypothetical protein